MPSTKVQKTCTTVVDEDGGEREQVQYRITIPRRIADEFDLEGIEFDWSVKSEDRP